jgi:hypothetical protein
MNPLFALLFSALIGKKRLGAVIALISGRVGREAKV